jgi:endoglucanase
MFQRWFYRRFLTNSGKLLLIAVLWLGGVGILGVITKLNLIQNIFHVNVQADGPVDIWWPTENASIDNIQTFKGMVKDKDASQYDMTWSVDDGQENQMYDSAADYAHKEAVVDLKGWTWHGTGPYKLTFKAKDKTGSVLGESHITVYIPGPAQGPTTIEAPISTSSAVSVVSELTKAVGVPTTLAATSSGSTVVLTSSQKDLNIWWPKDNATVEGTVTVQATVSEMPAERYQMIWQVDGGKNNDMFTDSSGTPHKKADIDVTGWNWHSDGKYKLTLTATDDWGQVVAKKDITIAVKNNTSLPDSTVQQTTQTSPVHEAIVTTDTTPTQSTGSNPLISAKLYVDQNSSAKRQADEWRSSRSQDAYQMDKIAKNAGAIWLGGWNSNISSDVQSRMSAAKSQGAVPVFVAYNIPLRDCGQYSAGGANSPDGYRSWIRSIADAIGTGNAAVVLEPDALALTSCLSQSQTQDRYSLMSQAVSILKSKPHIAVYVDAGHPNWISEDDMASRLNDSGVAKADGFALNVSNFYSTDSNISYGNGISSKVGGKHFIIDTSRNGLGPTSDSQWCNPNGRALGNKPTSNTGSSKIDAYLWLKAPGESDGNCNGGPNAGAWWADYALDLAKRAAY